MANKKKTGKQASSDKASMEDVSNLSPLERFRMFNADVMGKKFPNAVAENGKPKQMEEILRGYSCIQMPDLAQQWALGRPGFYCGRILFILGEPGVGKTARGLYILNKIQQMGGICAIVDWEHALTEELIAAYIDKPEEVDVYHARSLEQGQEMKRDLMKSFAQADPENKIPKGILGDSIGGTSSERQFEDDMEMTDSQVGGSGKSMALSVPFLNHLAAKHNVLDIYVGQARKIIPVGFSGPPRPYVDSLYSRGGDAVPFAASYFEILKKGSTLKEADKSKVGFSTTVFYKKNKPRTPFREVQYNINWSEENESKDGLSYVPHTMDMLALGNICGVKVSRNRYWCEAVGVDEGHKMEDAELYEIIHRPENIGMFQQELDIKIYDDGPEQPIPVDPAPAP